MNNSHLSPVTTAYHPVSKFQHWLMGLVWISAWLLGFVAVHLRDQLNGNYQLTFLHKAIASTVLFLAALRIVWRLTHPAPPLPATMSPVMQKAAHLGHYALYAVTLVALPISGWMISSVAGKPVLMLGIIHLPSLVAAAPEYEATARTVHEYLAWGSGLLVLGHICAALKHHLVDKDSVLASMLPTRKKSS